MEGVGGQYCPDSDTFFRREYDAQPYLPYNSIMDNYLFDLMYRIWYDLGSAVIRRGGNGKL